MNMLLFAKIRSLTNKLISSTGIETNLSYLADPTTNYLKTVTSLKAADKALDSKAKYHDDSLFSGLQGVNFGDVKIAGTPIIDATGKWVGSAAGIQGIQGRQGITGSNGTNGVQGATGSTGTQGTTGAQGTQGIQGITGSIGAQGTTGATGTQGTTGATGTQGITGVQGTIGAQGITGIKGTDGTSVALKGSVNLYSDLAAITPKVTGDLYIVITANASPVYAAGDGALWNGTTWVNVGPIRGVQGTTGTIGAQGTTGATGVQGTQGIQGIQGRQGITGTQGTTGTTGNTGTQGTTGATGSTGTQGITGATGAQGIQGIKGTDGIIGSNGAQGTQGIQGIQGRQGITGTQGTNGTQGIQGPIGPSTQLNTSEDTVSAVLLPVMVQSSGTNVLAKTTSTKFSFNAATGYLTATGGFTAGSDARLKHNIESLDGTRCLDIISKLNPVSFNWNDSNNPSFGLIAQELELIMPEIVKDGAEFKSVDYSAIIPILIKAVQELINK